MNIQERQDAINKYDKREGFWTERSLEQLGYSLNFFLTIGVAFVGYLITIRAKYPKFYFDFKSEIEWKLVIFYLVLAVAFFSVVIGSISIIIRLYDLRVTRHITSARKKTIQAYDSYLPEGYIDLSKENFFKTVFCKISFIHFTPQKPFNEVVSEFELLRKQAKILGNSTWATHNWQIFFFVFGIVIFGLSIL